MEYTQYKEAVEHQSNSPAHEALTPYWQEVIDIWQSDDPLEKLAEVAVVFRKDSLVLATGGPHIEFTTTGYLRARWGKGWIFSEPANAVQEEASRYLISLLEEIRRPD